MDAIQGLLVAVAIGFQDTAFVVVGAVVTLITLWLTSCLLR